VLVERFQPVVVVPAVLGDGIGVLLVLQEPWHLDTATPSSPAGPGKDVSLGGRFRLTSSPHRKPKVVSR